MRKYSEMKKEIGIGFILKRGQNRRRNSSGLLFGLLLVLVFFGSYGMTELINFGDDDVVNIEPVIEVENITEAAVSPISLSFSLLLGAKKAQVIDVLGEPTRSNGLTDYYKNSSVNYDRDGNVVGWKNVFGTLDEVLSKAKSGNLRLGIRSDEVIAALGTPSEIPKSKSYIWFYENAYLTFDSDWRVNGWNNIYGALNQAITLPSGGKLSLGISVEDVINAIGSPSEISYSNPYRWQYQNAYVTFNSDWNVNGWKNTYGELNQSFVVATGGKLSLGMSNDDVVAALGTPSEVTYANPFKWFYKNSWITFNSDWVVTGWKNIYDELNPALVVPTGGKIALGISRDAMLEVLGTPSEISHDNPYRWFYKNSSVTFGTDWMVSGWKDVYGELMPSFYTPQGGKLDVGSSSEDVISVLGTPTEIAVANQFLWTYKNSTIVFDTSWTVQEWKSVYGQFDGVFSGE